MCSWLVITNIQWFSHGSLSFLMLLSMIGIFHFAIMVLCFSACSCALSGYSSILFNIYCCTTSTFNCYLLILNILLIYYITPRLCFQFESKLWMNTLIIDMFAEEYNVIYLLSLPLVLTSCRHWTIVRFLIT